MAAYLGLSGWPGWGHDPAACLVVDGTLVAAVEEERLVRRRHAFGLTPINSIAHCLARGGLRLEDIEAVGIGWNGIERYVTRGLPAPCIDDIVSRFLPDELIGAGRRPPVRFLDHHECHAWSAVWSWPNGGRNAAVLVLDGQGDTASGSAFHWVNGNLRRIAEYPLETSLGYLFEAGCAYAGFEYHHAGKLMALAAMGHADESNFPLRWQGDELVAPFGPVKPGADGRAFEAGQLVDRHWLLWLRKTFGDPEQTPGVYDPAAALVKRVPQRGCRQRDVAATLQACLEQIVLRRARSLMEETNERSLCYTGGVALNCVANRLVSAAPWLDDLTIPPAANDAGTALGAALMLAYETDRVRPLDKMPFWGPSINQPAVVDACRDLGLAFERTDDPARACAEVIARGGVVARLSGALEFGPRALGHRSLLAPASPRNVALHLNTNIKGREPWRPFGAALTIDAAREHLESVRELPHMLVAARIEADENEQLTAVTHVDQTTRPQTVTAEDDPVLYDILKSVGRQTGSEAVINTSFNAAGLPLVATLRHAITDAFSTPIDLLIAEDVLVKRRGVR